MTRVGLHFAGHGMEVWVNGAIASAFAPAPRSHPRDFAVSPMSILWAASIQHGSTMIVAASRGASLVAGSALAPADAMSSANVRAAPPAIGKTVWAIAEGYIPDRSHGEGRELESHETACILNAGDRDARVQVTLYFADREPVGPYELTVPARRTHHLRFNELQAPPVPVGVDYASVFRSDVPIVIQHTRLDSRQAELALLTTIAYSE